VIAPAEGLSERKADDSRGEGTEAVHWGLIHFLARLITQDEFDGDGEGYSTVRS